MRVVLIILISQFAVLFQAQVVYDINSSGNNSFSTSSKIYHARNITLGATSYFITGGADLTYIASNEISLQDGFGADGFGTSAGQAGFMIDNNAMEVASFYTNGFNQIPKYNRFEIGIKVPATIQSQINSFLGGGTGLNPYDPDQVSIECRYEFPSLSEVYSRNAFYYREYAISGLRWAEQNVNDFYFRVRFAPPKTGAYTALVTLKINGSIYSVTSFDFNVVTSSNLGHLSVENTGLRKLKFEDGSIFFGVGQNSGYVLPAQPKLDSCETWVCRSPAQYDIYRGYITDVADNYGNFARARLDPFGFPIEWEQRKHYKLQPTPNLSLSQCINNYDHNQAFMWEFDKVMTLCENRGVYLMLNLLQDQSWTANGLPENADFDWSHNPYSALLGSTASGANSFFSDQTARNIYKKLLYYVHARWGYSPNIALWEMINETENLENYQTNPTFASNVKSWTCEMKTYLQGFYPFHPATTGNIGKDTPPTCLDVFSENSYSSNDDGCSGWANCNEFGRHAAAQNYATNSELFVFGELGAGNGGIDANFDREYHNTLWATTMMGGIATGQYWNDFEQLNNISHRSNLKALKTFASRIDWTVKYSIGRTDDEGGSSCETDGERRKVITFWQRNAAKDKIFGWAMNASSAWQYHQDEFVNPAVFVAVKDGQYGCLPGPAAYTVFDNSCNPAMKVLGLLPLTNYHIEIFDPYNSSNSSLTTINALSNSAGDLKFKRKMSEGIEDPFFPDYCFIITPQSEGRLVPDQNQTDTLSFLSGDTLCLNAMTLLNNGKYQFKWLSENSVISNDSVICLGSHIYDSIMRVHLEVTNQEDSSIYTKDYVFVNNDLTLKWKNKDISVYPNPTGSSVNILFSNSEPGDFTVDVYSQTGQLINSYRNEKHIPIDSFVNGLYLLRVNANKQLRTFKVLISK